MMVVDPDSYFTVIFLVFMFLLFVYP